MSIELELGWGMHDKGQYDHLSSERTAETSALNRLLDLADALDLTITFDIVGHLFHESCTGKHPGPHSKGWWKEDPGTDWETSPQFYAPDLIREIQQRPTNHELATHTYSHLLANKATPEQLDDELSRVKKVHSKLGLDTPTSVVMPRHQEPEYSILSAHGITTIRRPFEDYSPSFSNPISKLWWLLNRDHPKSTLTQNGGILETTCTPHPSLTSVLLPSGQTQPHPVFSAIPLNFRQTLHRQYLTNAINKGIEQETHIHLWSHIYNMSNEEQWSPIKQALSYLASRRDEGDITIKNMNELAGEVK